MELAEFPSSHGTRAGRLFLLRLDGLKLAYIWDLLLDRQTAKLKTLPNFPAIGMQPWRLANFNSINIKPCGAGRLVIVLQEIYLYTLQRMWCWEFFSLSWTEIRVTNECMRCALNHGPACSKTVSPWSQANCKGYTSHDFRWQATMRQWGSTSWWLCNIWLKYMALWLKSPNSMPAKFFHYTVTAHYIRHY